jgi:protein tyrosine/serine phosphatase
VTKIGDAQISETGRQRPAAPWWKWGLGIVVAGLAAWYISANAGHWKDRFIPRKLRAVDPGEIYASGQIDRHLIRQVLADNHINTIVSLVSDDPTDPDVQAELQATKDLAITRYVDSLYGDGTGDINVYANAVQQIVESHRTGKTILIHCSSGAQRTNGAVFFYRVLVEHKDADEAAREMMRNGYDSHSNSALIPYLNSHIAEMARLLNQRGVIASVPAPLPQITIH